MKWVPELDEEEQKELKSGQLSDQTTYMRMQTQIEKDDLVDDAFMQKHKSRIIACNKFAPLSNSPDSQIKLDRLRRIKMDLTEEAGLYEDAEKCALDNVGDYQSFRGRGGFFQEMQVTERHVVKQTPSEDAKKKAGMLSGFFGKKKSDEEEERD